MKNHTKKMGSEDFVAANRVVDTVIEGLKAIENTFDNNFSKAIDLIISIKGRVVVSGMGKSGHIARKIAATMASTGTPALFVHPGEASHGDLGMITRNDLVILLSNSGETYELKDIINYTKRFSIPLIGVITMVILSLLTNLVCLSTDLRKNRFLRLHGSHFPVSKYFISFI